VQTPQPTPLLKLRRFKLPLIVKMLTLGLLSILMGFWSLAGCNAVRLTDRLERKIGPELKFGRMAAALGAVKLKDGRVVILGGSPKEFLFIPWTGKNSIEILSKDRKTWSLSGIDMPYSISNSAYLLPDGRVFVFTGVYGYDPTSNATTPLGKLKKNMLPSGPVSALIIDIDKKTYKPIYRPKLNKLGGPPVVGKGPTLLQGTFDGSVQLKDGRIIRAGGRSQYLYPPKKEKMDKRCDLIGKTKQCRYCTGTTCNPYPDGEKGCKEAKDCPDINSIKVRCKGGACQFCNGGRCSSHPTQRACKAFTDCPPLDKISKTELNQIEIYTPPDAKNPVGRVQTIVMNERRRNLDLIELNDGRVLISGGKGPQGNGPEQVYQTTYLLTVPKKSETKIQLDPSKYLKKGPLLRIGREDHGTAILADGRVLITGGTNGEGRSTNISEIFDPTNNQMFNHSPMTAGREDHRGLRLGEWVVFLGGEVNDQEDQIRNTAEAFDRTTGAHISSFFLFSKADTINKQLCPGEKGFAGIDDFASVMLDERTLIIMGGQQGCQDRQGSYISPGIGSKRTLIIHLPAEE